MNEKQTIINVLNRILDVEYEFIWYYPQLAERITAKDKESARLLVGLGEDSVRHANQAMEAIHAFGSEPPLNIGQPPQGEVVAILQEMLEKEKHAAWLYRQAAGLTDSAETKQWLLGQVSEEERHTHLIEIILMKITGEPATGTSNPP